MAEQETTAPAAGKPHPAAPAHKEKTEPKPAPPRSRIEQWVDAYLATTAKELQPKKFAGTMEVTEFIPQIRVALARQQPPWLASFWQALAGALLGVGGASAAWHWLGPGLPRAVALVLFAVVFGYSLYRLLRPPGVRWQVDTLTNRVQWWKARGPAGEISLPACQSLDLVEQRVLGGFSYRIVVEPRWGNTIEIATTAKGARTRALLNALELVRALVNVLRLPVRVRLSRWAGTELDLPPLPQAEPAAAAAPGESGPSSAAGE